MGPAVILLLTSCESPILLLANVVLVVTTNRSHGSKEGGRLGRSRV